MVNAMLFLCFIYLNFTSGKRKEDGGESSDSRSGQFTPGKEPSGPVKIGGCLGSRDDLDTTASLRCLMCEWKEA